MLNFNENEFQVHMSTSLGLFLLVICGNYIGEILGCRLRSLLSDSIYVKHVMGIICLFFFVTLLTPYKNKDKDGNIKQEKVDKTLIRTFIIYIIYIMSARTNWRATILIYLLLFTIYILSLVERDYYNDDENKKKKIHVVQNYMFIISMAILLVGFIFYYIRKYNEYAIKKNTTFSNLTFFLGKIECSHDPTVLKI